MCRIKAEGRQVAESSHAPTAESSAQRITAVFDEPELMLAGKRLYVDIMLITPPLILYCNILPIYLAKALSLTSLQAFHDMALFVMVLSCLSLKKMSQLSANYKIPLLCALSVAIYSAYTAAIGQFGQREYFFALAFLPYFYLRWLDAHAGVRFARILFLATLVCSFMACLKPHFFFPILVYEIYLCFKGSRRNSLFLALLAPPTFYLLHFLFLPPEIRRVFWSEHVPFVLDRYYTFGFPWFVFRHALLRSLIFLIFIALGRRSTRPADQILVPIALTGLACLAIAIFQGMGFSYHFIPMDFLLCFGIPVLFGTLRKSWMGFATAALVLALLGRSVFHQSLVPRLAHDRALIMDELEQLTQPGEKIMLFTSNITYLYPAILLYGLQPGTRYLNYFPIAFFNNTKDRRQLLATHYPQPSELEPAEKIFVKRVADDLKSYKTTWLFFPKPATLMNLFVAPEFDSFEYFKSTGLLAQIQEHYNLAVDDENFLIFRYRE